MINRVCISINNRCNMNCTYCHFHEKKALIKEDEMNVFEILDNIRNYINLYNINPFKIGFVGNGEPLLEYDRLKLYITHISDLLKEKIVNAYIITNGTLVDREKIEYLTSNNVNIGFSIDGPREIHNKWRCNSFDRVMESIELYRDVVGEYPSMNCTVGRDALDDVQGVVSFFEPFESRITFSRMIGKYGVPLDEFNSFLDYAAQKLNVRRGGYDCTMYGGMCGAGVNNLFYANGKIYVCGNCVDIDSKFTSDTPLDEIHFNIPDFDRKLCYKESVVIK